MNAYRELDIDKLLGKARSGDDPAFEALLAQHRDRLKHMLSVRMDKQLSTRVDPSDVVQETFMRASDRRHAYFRETSVGFYPWLRSIAIERLIDLHRFHIEAIRRSVTLETTPGFSLSDESVNGLAAIAMRDLSPSQQVVRGELRDRIATALMELSEPLREALLLRFVEQLSINEAADIANTSVSAFRGRQIRALAKLRDVLDELRERS